MLDGVSLFTMMFDMVMMMMIMMMMMIDVHHDHDHYDVGLFCLSQTWFWSWLFLANHYFEPIVIRTRMDYLILYPGWVEPLTKPDDVDDAVDDNITANIWILIDIRVWGRATLQNMDKEKLNMISS